MPEGRGGEETWDDLEQLALGTIGMSEDEFYNCTPRTFANIVKGHNLKYRDELEREREIKYLLIAPNLGKEYKNKGPKELFPLSWDAPQKNKKPPKKLSPEELKKVVAKHKKEK